MKRDWRRNQVQLLSQAKELFARFTGVLVPEFQIAVGMTTDLFLRTDKAAYVVEIKGASPGDYLSFATWGQMAMYRTVIKSWDKSDVPVVLILVTNATLSDDLKASFEKSKIAVVEMEVGEDLTLTQQKLEGALRYLDLPVPEAKVSSVS